MFNFSTRINVSKNNIVEYLANNGLNFLNSNFSKVRAAKSLSSYMHNLWVGRLMLRITMYVVVYILNF